jgi:PadR family transcriptional regulator PadR
MARQRRCSNQTLALLEVFAGQPRTWRHGYDLAQTAGLKAGTLYPILKRLCERSILESKWQEPGYQGRPPRHMYRLTADGRVYAREQLELRDSFSYIGRIQGNQV